MSGIKQVKSTDPNWINEIPIEEFEDDTEDFTEILNLDPENDNLEED